MKNKLEGMHLKSTFAQKFYSNQVVPVYKQGEYIEQAIPNAELTECFDISKIDQMVLIRISYSI